MKRFDQYESYLSVLNRAKDEDLNNEFIKSGIIDKFFIQFELGWKLLKDLMKYEGRKEADTGSPREIIKEAYQIYDFMDEEIWIQMLSERNNMAYIYNEAAATELVNKILRNYVSEFRRMEENLKEHYGNLLKESNGYK